MTLLEHAQDALSRGLAVFPCVPRGKIPCGPPFLEHGVLGASTDPAQIFRWWSERPGCNVGVTGGTIVDCDSGLANLQEAQNFALLNGFPPTLIVRTGRRSSYGVQIHFNGQAISGDYLANGVSGEVRSGGSYGLWAGSIHPDTDERYQIVVDLPRAPVPENILAGSRTDSSGRGRIGGLVYAPLDLESAREKYGVLLYRAAHAGKGGRHHAANNVTYFASRAFLAGVFDEFSWLGEIVLPALSEADIKNQILSAVTPLYSKYERDLPKMLGDSWRSGLGRGPLELSLYHADIRILRTLSDDLKFQRAWDANTEDFPSAVHAKDYMLQRLIGAGCTDAQRVLRASRIFEMVQAQICFELNLSSIEGT